MSTRQLVWKKGNDTRTGWEVLSIPTSGTFTRDWTDRYYYLRDAAPVTWKEIAEAADVKELKRVFAHAFGH